MNGFVSKMLESPEQYGAQGNKSGTDAFFHVQFNPIWNAGVPIGNSYFVNNRYIIRNKKKTTEPKRNQTANKGPRPVPGSSAFIDLILVDTSHPEPFAGISIIR